MRFLILREGRCERARFFLLELTNYVTYVIQQYIFNEDDLNETQNIQSRNWDFLKHIFL